MTLAYCSDVTDVGMAALCRGCPKLTSLDIGGCTRLTERTVRAIGLHCRQIISLDLGGCRACVCFSSGSRVSGVHSVSLSSRATLSFYGQTQPRNVWIHKLRRVTGREITKVTALKILKVSRNWSTKPATTRAASLP